MGSASAFISPLKLRKLEKRHNIALLGSIEPTKDDNPTTETLVEEQKVEPTDKDDQIVNEAETESNMVRQIEIEKKNKNLLQDNDAMDAYMKDLCQKYF